MPVYYDPQTRLSEELSRFIGKYGPKIPQGPTPQETQQAWRNVLMETPVEGANVLPFMPKVNLNELATALGGTASSILSAPGLEMAQPLLYAGPKATGFARAKGKFSSMADKMPRFEIDDSKLKMIFSGADNPKLGELIQHEELFKNYPSLRDIRVFFEPDMTPNTARYTSFGERKVIKLGPSTPDQAKKNILHEITHPIQDIEGFASGGTPQRFVDARITEAFNQGNTSLSPVEYEKIKQKAFLDYKNLAGEIEARDAAARMGLTKEQRLTTPPYSSEDIPLKDWIVRKEGKEAALSKMRVPTGERILYKGIGRTEGEIRGGLPNPNDMGNIFSTTDPKLAEKYAAWGGEHEGVLTFRYKPESKIANLDNPKVQKELINALKNNDDWTYYGGEDLNKPENVKAFLKELKEGYEEGAIFDNNAVLQELGAMGYDGGQIKKTVVFWNKDMLEPIKYTKRGK